MAIKPNSRNDFLIRVDGCETRLVDVEGEVLDKTATGEIILIISDVKMELGSSVISIFSKLAAI